jgi:hypothetical protein
MFLPGGVDFDLSSEARQYLFRLQARDFRAAQRSASSKGGIYLV